MFCFKISSLEAQLSKLQYELTDLDTTRTDQVNRQEGVLARCQNELAALNNKYNIALREVGFHKRHICDQNLTLFGS